MSKEPTTSVQEEAPKINTMDEKPSYMGISIGVLIALLTFVLIGLFLWGTTLNKTQTPDEFIPQRPTAAENNEPESTKAKAETETLQAISPSDELNAIEADLGATAIDEIDTELNAIEAELEATLQ